MPPTPAGLSASAGVVHSGGAVGDATGRRLVVFNPAGMEEFFRELGTVSPEDQIDTAAALAAATRHGWRFIA